MPGEIQHPTAATALSCSGAYPAPGSHWDRLPPGLQGHIRALATEAHTSEHFPTCVQDAVIAAVRRKTKRIARNVIHFHHDKMALARLERMIDGIQKVPATQEHKLWLMSFWCEWRTITLESMNKTRKAYKAAVVDLTGVVQDMHTTMPNSATCCACTELFNVAASSARFYLSM